MDLYLLIRTTNAYRPKAVALGGAEGYHHVSDVVNWRTEADWLRPRRFSKLEFKKGFVIRVTDVRDTKWRAVIDRLMAQYEERDKKGVLTRFMFRRYGIGDYRESLASKLALAETLYTKEVAEAYFRDDKEQPVTSIPSVSWATLAASIYDKVTNTKAKVGDLETPLTVRVA